MSSWLLESEPGWAERFACRVLQAGPIPRHVAFIMDGNRRFARLNRLAGPLQGHQMGFQRLAKTLEWCRNLGITEVTVYAFSIENFKRSKSEVDGLFAIAREKFAELMAEKEKLREHGIRIRFLGNLALLPPDLQQLMARIQHYSSDHDREISEELMEACLDTEGSEVDLLVRTSGEQRLSDFLLWQSAAAVLYFTPVLWPEFTFWHLARAVLHYQRHLPRLQVRSNVSWIRK